MDVQVLVVEDDPDVLLLLQDLLESYPWTFVVRSTGRGRDAIELARQAPPDLVLLDVRLADEVNGLTVARELRSHPATVHAKIVILSAMDDPIDQHAGKRAGADEYVTKPVQNRILLAVLTELLDS
ncbi:MAG: response regulator [Anaerolineae bacterium]|nr:response regulator [Anaerolineae bacterium]